VPDRAVGADRVGAWALRRAAGLRVLALLFVAVAIAACTVRLVSNYDDVFDQKVTELQKKVDSYLVTAAQGTNGDFAAFAADVKGDLAVIAARANGIDKNDLTIKQVESLRAAFDDVEKIHARGPDAFKASALVQADLLDTIFRAIIKLELAKKRE
jgi:hypothetical protein